MIKTENLTKQFDTTTALDCLSTTIEEGRIYGLVGSNGAGKSTLLRLLAGVYRPTSGSVEIDGEPVFENPALKQKIFFIPDELYQMPGASLASLANIYRALYHSWSDERYQELVGRFPIPPERKLSACSKGMRRQIAIILALSCQPKYLLLDEAFDGLDPVIRVAVRKLIADDILQRGTTVLIASHNLRGAGGHVRRSGAAARRKNSVPAGAERAAFRLCQGAADCPPAAGTGAAASACRYPFL